MKDFVIDADALISLLTIRAPWSSPILNYFKFKSSDLVFVAFELYLETLKSKVKISRRAFSRSNRAIFSRVTMFTKNDLSEESLEKTKKILGEADLKDAIYVALAIQLDIPLITGDRILYEHLRKEGFEKVILFKDVLQILSAIRI